MICAIMSRIPTLNPPQEKTKEKFMGFNIAKGITYGLAIGDAMGRLNESVQIYQEPTKNGNSSHKNEGFPYLHMDICRR